MFSGSFIQSPSVFAIIISKFAVVKLILQNFATATEEFSEPAVASLCKLSTVRPWPLCNELLRSAADRNFGSATKFEGPT